MKTFQLLAEDSGERERRKKKIELSSQLGFFGLSRGIIDVNVLLLSTRL
jgi:hypothetical protein